MPGYHSFKDSLAKGAAGEEALLALWPDLEKLDGRRSDFIFKSSGEKLELKTDSYDMNKTPNFFIERFSDMEKGSPGSVWQAYGHGSKFLAYFYPKNGVLFLFDTEQLVCFLTPDKLELFTPVHIKNKSWTTLGYKIPREFLKHLYTEFRFDTTR